MWCLNLQKKIERYWSLNQKLQHHQINTTIKIESSIRMENYDYTSIMFSPRQATITPSLPMNMGTCACLIHVNNFQKVTANIL
jgi:hypothetical protein